MEPCEFRNLAGLHIRLNLLMEKNVCCAELDWVMQQLWLFSPSVVWIVLSCTSLFTPQQFCLNNLVSDSIHDTSQCVKCRELLIFVKEISNIKMFYGVMTLWLGQTSTYKDSKYFFLEGSQFVFLYVKQEAGKCLTSFPKNFKQASGQWSICPGTYYHINF